MGKFAKLIIVGVALACLSKLQYPTFVTPPRGAVPVSAAAAIALASTPAFADPIGDAAKTLAAKSYPFLKDIDWNSDVITRTALTRPGPASSTEWTKAIAKAIDMGASMDAGLLQKGVQAHHAGILSALSDKRGLTSQDSYEGILAALGRMIASVPEAKTMAVYDSFGKLVSKDVPAYLQSTVNKADSEAAYQALLEFKDVVKANPITPGAAPVSANPDIEAAAAKLAFNAYPFLKNIQWNSDIYLKTEGYTTPQKVLNAVDKALVMGASMNGGALKEAAQAHVKAIDNMNDKGVTTEADFAAIISGLGKAIASVPEKQVMDVFEGFKFAVGGNVPFYLFQTAGGDASLAYNSLMAFKDVVKASQAR